MVKYGQAIPPIIELSKIVNVPMALFVGKQDPLSNPAVGQWTKSHLNGVVHYEEIDKHDHSSFYLSNK